MRPQTPRSNTAVILPLLHRAQHVVHYYEQVWHSTSPRTASIAEHANQNALTPQSTSRVRRGRSVGSSIMTRPVQAASSETFGRISSTSSYRISAPSASDSTTNRSVLRSAPSIAVSLIRSTLRLPSNSKRKWPTWIRSIPIGVDSNPHASWQSRCKAN